jgi:methylphosphotriester-DNA--protein-cysteine methyltransferase
VVIRALLDSTLPMPAFLACAAVLKSTVALRPAGAMFPLADKAYTVIMETLGRPKPTDFHVSTALTMLEEAAAQCKRLKGEEIARTRNLDPSHLSRLIKAETGFGFTDWRTAFLIRPSLAVLADTKEHVKQIACQLLGFKYQSQFDEEFERFFGLTPTAFRELARAAASKLL